VTFTTATGLVTTAEHLDLPDLVTNCAMKVRHLAKVDVEPELRPQVGVKGINLLEVEMKITRKFPNATTDIYCSPEVLDERLAQ